MKYKLINTQTKEEHLCKKVTIGDFDYYLDIDTLNFREVATNNPNSHIPKVVDEIEDLIQKSKVRKTFQGTSYFAQERLAFDRGYIEGYNKSQETHPFSVDDADAYADAVMGGCLLSAKEWKEQQPKVIYYN